MSWIWSEVVVGTVYLDQELRHPQLARGMTRIWDDVHFTVPFCRLSFTALPHDLPMSQPVKVIA